MHGVKASVSSGSSRGVVPAQASGRASRPGIVRAYTEKRPVAGNASVRNVHMNELVARIKKQLQQVELPPSPYDAAWVSMVPLRGSGQTPCFPQCVEWILQNQQDDGSWGISQSDSSVSKSVLLSTLACVLALKRWNVGKESIWKGLHFIGRNLSVALSEQIISPVGFSITFPGLLSLAMGMDLELPVRQTDVDAILLLREGDMKRFVDG